VKVAEYGWRKLDEDTRPYPADTIQRSARAPEALAMGNNSCTTLQCPPE
jgi:hypothetical protein